MFDPRPLCCSSLTTAVGGTTDTNFVDSAHPTVARIRGSSGNPDAPGPGLVIAASTRVNPHLEPGPFGGPYPQSAAGRS